MPCFLKMYSENGRARSEVTRLVQECLLTSHDFDDTFDLRKVKLIPLTCGYSDSRIFRVLSSSRNGNFRHIQSVIKISAVD